ncbi:MAG: methyltransferase [Desulfamplus sp.]|nr:methyltransferase [Desulfamplus sp.]
MEKFTTEFSNFCTPEITKLFDTAKDIQIIQPEKGYRFSIDPILLFSSLVLEENENILDIGTGCGIMPILIALKYPRIHITAVEIQNELADIAQKNIEINNLTARIRLIKQDIKNIQLIAIKSSYSSNINKSLYTDRTLYMNGGFDRVISNPPYKKKGSGRLNPNVQKSIARHEITLTLDELISCAYLFLKPDGVLNLVYPADRLKELLYTMKHHSIEPVEVKFINTSYIKSDKPKLVLATGIRT